TIRDFLKQQPDSKVSVLNHFKDAVVRTPNALAVVDSSEKLSYLQLDLLSNQYAHFLTSTGLKVTARIGCQLPRNNRWIALILGVMKAGMTYVALSPDIPAERVYEICETDGMEALISTEIILDDYPSFDYSPVRAFAIENIDDDLVNYS